MSLRLTPAGRLRWEPSENEAAPAGPPSLQGAFETDWREALFTLAAEKTPTRVMPNVRYWQQLAERHNDGPKAVSRIAHVASGGLLPSQCSLARVARTLSPNAIKVEPNRACGGRPATATEVTQDSGGRPPRPGRSSTSSPSGVADFRVARIKSVPAGANVLVHACVDLSGLHQRPHRLDQTLTGD